VASEIGLGALVELLRPVLAALARDTLNGFVAFSLPGQDPYSHAQGTPRAEPGGIEAQGTDFLIENLDRFLAFPDALAKPAASALVTALSELSLPLPIGLGGVLGGGLVKIGLIDDAVRYILQNDDTMPISLPVALLLNYVATVVSPASLQGAFLSPFARLSFANKARAMELLETSQSQLVAVVDAQLPQPLKASASGLLEFLGGALHEFAAFGSMGEHTELQAGVPVATAVTWRVGATGEQHTETARVIVMAAGTTETPPTSTSWSACSTATPTRRRGPRRPRAPTSPAGAAWSRSGSARRCRRSRCSSATAARAATTPTAGA
jgi:hypothetical protein